MMMNVHSSWLMSIGGGRRFRMGAKPQGVWGTGVPPAGSRGGAPVGSLGAKSPRS